MDVTIRTATEDDFTALGRMAAELVRFHHALDDKRFLIVDNIEHGYGRWLVRESTNEKAVVLVAELGGQVVGYAWATLEDRDWMLLREACGALQDIYVEETARRRGVARKLLEEMSTRLRALGAPRVVLMTAAKNDAAQRFFESLGFRRTMIEMTQELGT